MHRLNYVPDWLLDKENRRGTSGVHCVHLNLLKCLAIPVVESILEGFEDGHLILQSQSKKLHHVLGGAKTMNSITLSSITH
jgi:hypothetical protein